MQDVTQNLGPYALAGLGLLVVVFPLVFVMIFVIYGFMAVGMAATFALAAPASSGSGSGAPPWVPALVMSGIFFLVFVAIVMMNAVMAPLSASLTRAIAAHQRGEAELGFNAVFSTATSQLGKSIGVQLAVSGLALVGMLFCYFPLFIVVFFSMLAWPLAVLHGVPVGRALRLSVRHVHSDYGFALKFGLLMLLVNMIAGYVPVVGPMFATAYFVRVYRELVGDGPEPVI